MANKLLLNFVVRDDGNIVLKKVNANLSKMNKRAFTVGKTLKHVFASSVMLQGLQLFKTGISDSVREVFEFNKIFKQVEGITRASDTSLKSLQKTTLAVSNTTEHTATALGAVALQLSKIGLEADEITIALPQMADLATASVYDLSESTVVATDTMRAFNMEVTDLEHISNVMLGTIASTSIATKDYAESMKFIAPIAKTMGVSLEETSAMIGVLGNIGIKGSLGGTTLKNMFLNIMKPSDDVKKVIMGLNNEGLTFTKILKGMHDAGIPIQSFLETFNKRAVAGSLGLSTLTDKVKELTKLLESDDFDTATAANVMREAWIPAMQNVLNTFRNVFTTMSVILNDSDLGLNINKISDMFLKMQKDLMDNPDVLIKFTKDLSFFIEKAISLSTTVLPVLAGQLQHLGTIIQLLIGYKLSKYFLGVGASAGNAAIRLGKIAETSKRANIAMFGVQTTAPKVASALLGIQASIPVLLAVATAAFALYKALEWVWSTSVKIERQKISAAWGGGEEQIKKQISALKKWKKEVLDLQDIQMFDQIKKNKAQMEGLDIMGPAGTANRLLLKDLNKRNKLLEQGLSDKEGFIAKSRKLFEQELQMSEEFFNLKGEMFDAQLAKLEKDLATLQSTKGTMTQVEKLEKEIADLKAKIFGKGGGDGDGKGIKKAAEKTGADYFKALISNFESIAAQVDLSVSVLKAVENVSYELEKTDLVSKVAKAFGVEEYDKIFDSMGKGFDEYSSNIRQSMSTYQFMLKTFGADSLETFEDSPFAKYLEEGWEVDTAETIEKQKALWMSFVAFMHKNSKVMKGFGKGGGGDDDDDDDDDGEGPLTGQAAFKEVVESEEFDAYLEAGQVTYEAINTMMDMQFEKLKEQHAEELRMLEEKSKIELKLAGNNIYKKAILEAKFSREKKKLLAEQAKAEEEAAEKRRQIAIFDVWINTAVAIVKTISNLGANNPAAWVLSAAMIGLAGVQTAMIAQQEYYEGGYTGRGNPRDVAGFVHKDEYVVNSKKLNAIGGVDNLEGMMDRSINNGGSGKNINVYVDNMIGTEEYKREFFLELQQEAQRW